MAEIVQSLFGVTPESYQRAQQDRIDAQALRYAQLDPFQQAQYGLVRAGNMLGGAIGGALGGQDPELQRVTMRQQIARQLNPNDLSTFEQAYNALIPVDPEGAMMVRAELEKVQMGQAKLESERALAGQRTASATASLREKQGEDPVQQLLRTGKFTPASVAAYQKSSEIADLKPVDSAMKTQVVETADGQLLVDMGTGQTIANLGAAPDRRAVSNVNVGVKLPPQETKFEEGLGGGQSKRILDNQVVAQDAAEILRTNQVGRDILKSGAITGTGANLFVGLNNALAKAGIDFGYADAAANSQAYVATMGANVGRIIKQFGAGTGLSDADREYAAKIAAGEIALTETALRRILSINDRAANRAIDLHNKNVKDIKTNVPLTVEKPAFDKPAPSAANQIPGQIPAPAAATSAPMYARNPQTNERVVSTDGGKTWNPVR